MILGIDALRAASDGSPLASARNVSLTVFDDQTETRFRPHFGHHKVRTVYQSRLAIHSSAFSSVLNGSTIPQDLADKSCLPNPISPDDEFFNANGTVRKTCMNFVRSITGLRLDCSLGYADQVNTKTHWLDLSPIYGVDENTVKIIASILRRLIKPNFRGDQ